MRQTFQFRAIGFAQSPYKEKFGTPRQPGLVAGTIGHIQLCDDLNPDAFDGLAEFSHAWIVFAFHANESFKSGKAFCKTKVHPPRLEGKAIGVFASRSPHRPNPIGLSLVKIEKVEDRTLTVSGLDLIDGTPILDIKPYLPSIEATAEAREGWSAKIDSPTFQVSWSDTAKRDVLVLTSHLNDQSRKATLEAIENIVKLDPRPVAYRGTVENPDPYMSRYGFRFEDWNVVFEMKPVSAETGGEARRRVEIVSLEKWPST
jgi:tRNA-Thr(GGU) m(6)t(6)A37 methyltransferase TsaA